MINAPCRIMTEAIGAGGSNLQIISQADLDTVLDEYYAAHGWDKEGNPNKIKLKELGI